MNKTIWLKNENLHQWDEFVQAHPNGCVFHLSLWKKVLENSFQHIQGHIAAVVDSQSGKIFAGIPVYFVKSWLTGNRLVSIPFASMLDPLVLDSGEMTQVFSKILELKEQLGASSVEIRMARSENPPTKDNICISSDYEHHVLSLDTDLSETMGKMKRRVRRIVKKLPECALDLKIAGRETDLQEFYQLLCLSRKRLGLPPIPYRFFKFQWDILHPKNFSTVLVAEHEGRPIASLLVLKYRNTLSLEYLGENTRYRKLNPVHFLYWEAIKMAHREGLKKVSFGRTAKSNIGLITFKKNWGTERLNSKEIYCAASCSKYVRRNDSSWQYKLIQNMTKHSPMSVAKMIGSFCYRHMG